MLKKQLVAAGLTPQLAGGAPMQGVSSMTPQLRAEGPCPPWHRVRSQPFAAPPPSDRPVSSLAATRSNQSPTSRRKQNAAVSGWNSNGTFQQPLRRGNRTFPFYRAIPDPAPRVAIPHSFKNPKPRQVSHSASTTQGHVLSTKDVVANRRASKAILDAQAAVCDAEFSLCYGKDPSSSFKAASQALRTLDRPASAFDPSALGSTKQLRAGHVKWAPALHLERNLMRGGEFLRSFNVL